VAEANGSPPPYTPDTPPADTPTPGPAPKAGKIDTFITGGKIPPTYNVNLALETIPTGLHSAFTDFWNLLHGSFPKLIADVISFSVAGIIATAAASVEAVAPLVAEIDQLYEIGKQKINVGQPITLLDPSTLSEMLRRFPGAGALFTDHLQRAGYGPDERDVLKELTYKLTPEAVTLEAYRRRLASERATRVALTLQGYTSHSADNIIATSFTQLDPTTILAAWLRGIIQHDKIDSELSALGYSGVDVDRLKQLSHLIPPVQDLVRFAVREAFNPAQIQALDLDQEFPAEFGEWSAKLGLDEQWQHRYWESHWELPSVGQGIAMFHRTTFTAPTASSPVLGTVKGKPYYRILDKPALDSLIKAQDFAPTWRQKLTDIGFNTFTRVDIRRMYALGILDVDEVKKAYIDDGYEEDKAQNLADFTVAEETESTIGRVLSDIENKFVDAIATESELLSVLHDAKWSEWRIAALVDALKIKRELKARAIIVHAIKQQYLHHLQEIPSVTASLLSNGVPVESTALLIKEWVNERAAQVERLRLTDLASAYGQGLLDHDKAISMLTARGMPPDDRDIWIKLHAPKPPKPSQSPP
jgi:hypothetical protein